MLNLEWQIFGFAFMVTKYTNLLAKIFANFNGNNFFLKLNVKEFNGAPIVRRKINDDQGMISFRRQSLGINLMVNGAMAPRQYAIAALGWFGYNTHQDGFLRHV